jgi:SAM-dependent methyltransferase
MTTASADTSAANTDQIAFWNSVAGQTWAALQENLDRQIEPLGALAMDALAPRLGERVIDIGCGCGQTSFALARRLGPTGGVLGVDISAPMLAVAKRRADREPQAEVRFLEADAQTHPFEPAGADCAYSRFGVMFFADPIAAFANIRAGLRSGGRIALVCWRTMALNPFMTAPLEAILPLLPEAPSTSDPNAPGPFAFADPLRVEQILARAGYRDIVLRPHDEAIGGRDVEQSVNTALRIGPLGAALRERPELTAAVEVAVREVMVRHLTDRGVRLPSASWIVTARVPEEG